MNLNRTLDNENVVSDDIDDNLLIVDISANGILNDDEFLSFINSHFFNDLAPSSSRNYNKSNTIQESNRKGLRIAWVENSQTRELIPVARRITIDDLGKSEHEIGQNGDLESNVGVAALIEAHDGAFEHSPLIIKGPKELSNIVETDDRRDVDEVVSTISSYNNLVMLQRGVFLIFQGILAGFAFSTLYLRQASAGDDSKFLLYYQPNAQEFRRYFYLLSTIAVVGSMDSLLTIINSRDEASSERQQMQPSAYHRTHTLMKTNYDLFSLGLVMLTAILHCVAFLCTLLMTAQDVLISNQNGFTSHHSAAAATSSDGEWISAALADSSFRSGLTEWKGLDEARLICAVLAWLGCCVFVWNGLTQLNSKSADLYRVGEVALAWRHRTELLEGDHGLERLSAVELRRLIQQQKVGLERTTAALSFFEANSTKNP